MMGLSMARLNGCYKESIDDAQQYYILPDIINMLRRTCSVLLHLMIVLTLSGWVLASACQERCFETPQGCQVCFQQCNSDSQTAYSFLSCVQNVHPASQHSHSHHQQDTNNYDKQQCSQHCCMSIFSEFEIQGFSNCQEASKHSYTLMIIIGVIVLGVIVVCCLIAGNTRIRSRCASCLCQRWIKQGTTPEVHPQVSLQHAEQLEKSSYIIDSSAPQLEDGICAICLSAGCRVATRCGHSFHLTCLWQWLRRKAECPLCKSALGVSKVWLYCLVCSREVMKVPPCKLGRLKVMELKHYTCQECLAGTKS